MADEEQPPMTIKERMAALKLSQVGQQLGTARQSHCPPKGAVPPPAQRRQPPPPPVRPQLPARPDRPQSTNVPPTQDHAPAANHPIGNLPEQGAPSGITANGSNGASRPPLPSRTPTQSSQVSKGPALPPRRPSGNPSPALPPRRPSEAPSDFDRSRRGSNESMSSIATTRSSVSGLSNATSLTSQSERYKIRAPEFDPSKLPPLPPKRTTEEREAADRKYAGMRPLRHTKSMPRVEQVGKNGTTPPPPKRQPVIQPPVVPSFDSRAEPQEERLAIERAPRQRAEPLPPPPPPRAEPAMPPRPKRSALDYGMNKATDTPPPLPHVRPGSSQGNGAPPAIPTSSKPDLKALQASKPKPNGVSTTSNAPTSISGPIDIISASQFDQCLASSRAVVADFWAPWCGPCRNFAPTYTELSHELSRPGQVTFIKVNTDENKDLLSRYKIEAWPTILVFDQQREVGERITGVNEWPIRAKLDEIAHSAPAPAPAVAASAPLSYSASNSCLHCRDFSGPDDHAARFPRQSIPSTDIGWLAQQLTSPFPSLTDKARAIFTWLHHNVAYDTVAFFGNNVKPSTPQGTLQSGLAVCEGYAGLFAALALKVGLEAVVVSGHGKGFGHTELQPGDPLPRYNAGHAWNAVRLDNGEWKLIDCCWGAGHLGANQAYNKSFSPERFTQTNNDFGLDHFPGDDSQQFRTDGRIITWEQYITGNKSGCGADFFSGFVAEEGLAKTTFQPVEKKIVLAQQGPTVRFAFQKVCPHWDPIRCGNGPYYIYVLCLENLKDAGLDRNFIPFETNGDVWWRDVPLQDLGNRPGLKCEIFTVTKWNNRDGRGVTLDEFKRSRGRVGLAFGGVCKWETA